MKNRTLYISNGPCLTSYLKVLNVYADFLVQHEILCDGPKSEIIDSYQFLSIRKAFSGLKSLSKLKKSQLINHFESRIKLAKPNISCVRDKQYDYYFLQKQNKLMNIVCNAN